MKSKWVFLRKFLVRLVLEGDVLALLDTVVEDQTGDEDGGEDRSDDTDDQRRGEALDRTGTEDEEDDTGKEGGHLTVDDGGISVLVTVGDSLAQTLAGGKLLLDTFIYDNVGIHSHTHGQDETGDTRQGQDSSERDEDSEEEKHVAEKGDVSGDTGSLIEEYHVEEDEQEGDQEGYHTSPDRLGTEGRSDDLLLDDGCRGGKLTGLEDVHKVGGLFRSEMTGDGGVSACDGAVDVRIGIHHAVEDDGDLPSYVVTSHAGPDVGALGVHAHGNGRLTVGAMVIDHAGVGDDTTVKLGLSVAGSGLDGHEFEDVVSLEHLGRLDGPHRAELGREDLGDLRHGEIPVDLGSVDCGSETDAGIAGVL